MKASNSEGEKNKDWAKEAMNVINLPIGSRSVTEALLR